VENINLLRKLILLREILKIYVTEEKEKLSVEIVHIHVSLEPYLNVT
jgi:hypothetical protein